MNNIIDLNHFKTLSEANFWDCPRCHDTYTENVTVCSCKYKSDDKLFYKFTLEQVMEFLTNKME